MYRTYNLKMYYKDSPVPEYLEKICDIITEGGLLRLVRENDGSIWIPLTNIYTIEEMDKTDNA